jgi:hypothetical protein
MRDSRLSNTITHHACQLAPNGYDIVWIDSTFYDHAWDVMPTMGQSISTLLRFAQSKKSCLAVEFELLGTEVLLEALMEVFPGESVLVLEHRRMEQLQIIFADNEQVLKRLVYHDSESVGWDQHRVIVIPRRMKLPDGVVRLRATTQRWANRIRRLENEQSISIIEVNEERNECFIFFSFHSCKREIDEFTQCIGARSVVKLVKSIDISLPSPDRDPPPTERPRRLRCQRHPFPFSSDPVWLDSLIDSQDTIPPQLCEDEEIILPTWGTR